MAVHRKEEIASGITVYLGDCQEMLPKFIKKDTACVTDPPYGIASTWKGGKGHGWGKTDKDKEVRNKWDDKPPSKKIFDLILKFDEVIIWGGNYFILPPSRGWLVWTKPERNFTLSEAELAWTNFDKIIRVFDGARGVRSDPNREHPTQKPVRIMHWCVEKTKSKIVIDPYMGSGTTGVAAIENGRQFIGIEAYEPYFDIACRRLDSALRQGSLIVKKPKPKKQLGFFR